MTSRRGTQRRVHSAIIPRTVGASHLLLCMTRAGLSQPDQMIPHTHRAYYQFLKQGELDWLLYHSDGTGSFFIFTIFFSFILLFFLFFPPRYPLRLLVLEQGIFSIHQKKQKNNYNKNKNKNIA